MNKNNFLEKFSVLSSLPGRFVAAVVICVLMGLPLAAVAASYSYESLPDLAIKDNVCVETSIPISDNFIVTDLARILHKPS